MLPGDEPLLLKNVLTSRSDSCGRAVSEIGQHFCPCVGIQFLNMDGAHAAARCRGVPLTDAASSCEGFLHVGSFPSIRDLRQTDEPRINLAAKETQVLSNPLRCGSGTRWLPR